jgi:2,4-dienoyl-CoA reductase-like NADH-dependent reductase (Old Yellow Enzyme family)
MAIDGTDKSKIMTHERFRFRDRDELEEKISELRLDIPLSDDISVLFSPVVVAGRTLPNRFLIHPMEGADAEPDGAPSPLTFRRYRRFAAGGAAVIWFEAAAVVESGRGNPRQLLINAGTCDGFKRLVEATKRATAANLGPGHSPFLILQLTHAGRFARPKTRPRPMISQRSPILDGLVGLPPDFPLLRDDELASIRDSFVSAARIARSAGFDAVDIKACHGYLVSELLSAFTRPESRYGGSLENRARFLIETAAGIKAEVPGIEVTSRLNVFDALPYPHGFGVDRNDPMTPDLTEPIELMGILRKSGLLLLSVSCGIPACRPHFGRPYDRPMTGQAPPGEHPLAGVARLLRLTGEVQRAHPALPVAGSSYSWLRQFFPHAAAAAVETGKASLVGLGRGSIAYPDWVSDLAEKGVLDSRRVCIACSKCSEMLRWGSRVGCAVRDAEIYAAEYRKARTAARRALRASRRAGR